jgi:stage II sporulation protein R
MIFMKRFLSKELTAKFVLIPTAVFLGLVITICITAVTSFAEEYENLQKNVLRLHVLANSDSEADQALKLKVRDAVLAATAEDFAKSGQAESAAIVSAAASLDKIYEAAIAEIRRNGYDYDVTVELTDIPFDARVYDVNGKGFTMPEGVYTAVRITIGTGEGKNWWCVMFPPLCLPAVTAESAAVMSESFTDEQIDIMSEPTKYEAKLYVVELWNKVFSE